MKNENQITKPAKKWYGRGFMLTEAAIVLGITGLILGAVWATASSVRKAATIQTEADSILSILSNIRSFYRSQNSNHYASDADFSTAMKSIKAFPLSLLDSNGTPHNAFGGTYTLTRGSDVHYFRISLDAIPDKAACINFISAIIGFNGLYKIKSSGEWVSVTGTTKPTSFSCSCNTSGSACSTGFEFYLWDTSVM